MCVQEYVTNLSSFYSCRCYFSFPLSSFFSFFHSVLLQFNQVQLSAAVMLWLSLVRLLVCVNVIFVGLINFLVQISFTNIIMIPLLAFSVSNVLYVYNSFTWPILNLALRALAGCELFTHVRPERRQIICHFALTFCIFKMLYSNNFVVKTY